MLPSRKIAWVGWAVLAGCLTSAGWAGPGPAVAAETRPFGPRGFVPKPRTPPTTPTEPETPLPKDTVLGEDHEKNIQAMQFEKLGLLRHRVAVLTRAMAAGQATQQQVDHATIDELRMELDLQTRPHLRVAAMEKLVELLKRFEDEAKQRVMTPKKSNDASAALSAHGRYISARLARINAQMSLEREKMAFEREGSKTEPPR